jgi:hypothetical protein
MPVPGLVRTTAGESAGQVLPPAGAIARDGSHIAAARGGLTCAIYELRASLGGVHYRILYFFKWGNRGSGLVRTCKGKGSPTEGD